MVDKECDVNEWLTSQSQASVNKLPQFIVKAKQTLYIPPGIFAVSVGIDTRSEAALRSCKRQQTPVEPEKGNPWVSYMILPLFDKNRVVALGPKHVAAVKSTFTAGITRMPTTTSLVAVAPQIKQWLDSL